MKKLDRQVWAAQLAFRSFGVRIGVRLGDRNLLDQVTACLPPGWKQIHDGKVDRLYSIIAPKINRRPNIQGLYLLFAETHCLARTRNVASMLRALESDVASYVGQTSRRWSFVHAGVVGWKGRAIVLPGRSFSGKTTIVREFLRAGAEYYSDEFAPIDSHGWVHPFPRCLSIRQDGMEDPRRIPPEHFGARTGQTALPVTLIVLTQYRPAARWRPQPTTRGTGVLALLANSLSAQNAPLRTMTSFKRAVQHAHILEGDRGKAFEAVDCILEWIERCSKEPETTTLLASEGNAG